MSPIAATCSPGPASLDRRMSEECLEQRIPRRLTFFLHHAEVILMEECNKVVHLIAIIDQSSGGIDISTLEYLLSAWIRSNSLQIANKELHSTIVVFGPKLCFGVALDCARWDQEPITEIVQVPRWNRLIDSSKNCFNSRTVDAIGADDYIRSNDGAIRQRDGRYIRILKGHCEWFS